MLLFRIFFCERVRACVCIYISVLSSSRDALYVCMCVCVHVKVLLSFFSISLDRDYPFGRSVGGKQHRKQQHGREEEH